MSTETTQSLPKQRVTKKEFVTYWTRELVHAAVSRMPLTRQRYFEEIVESRGTHVIMPDTIAYQDLTFCEGKKTKVTIEIIE